MTHTPTAAPTTEKAPWGSIRRALQSAQDKIDALAQFQQALREIDTACALPTGVIVTVLDTYISIHIPFNLATVRATRLALGPRLRRLTVRTASDGSAGRWDCEWIMDNGQRAAILVWLSPDIEGATCRKVQVGTKTEPVYEIVCDVVQA